jgi:DNA-directed RNA polymerase subunit RPC12/RpoP
MLRTKCIWCGKTVRGGDDWAGRSGKCPNCQAEIIFPRIGPPPTEPEPVASTPLIDLENWWNTEGWGGAAIMAIIGVAAWVWGRLIIFFAYGYQAYWAGLYVTVFGKEFGVALNNGQRLNFFWTLVYVSGFATTLFLLIRVANYLVLQTRPRSRALTLIFLAGVAAWGSMLWQATSQNYLRYSHFNAGSTRQAFFTLVVVLVTGGMVAWRDWKSGLVTEEFVKTVGSDEESTQVS